MDSPAQRRENGAAPDARKRLAGGPRAADLLPRLLAALDGALEAIGPPVFVLDLEGNILHMNANAHILLTHDSRVKPSLRGVVVGSPSALDWDLTPLRGRRAAAGFLAILDAPPRVANSIDAAARRWRLTARQGQVLDLVVRGLTNAMIGDTLKIGRGTVEFHLSAIFDKAGVDNRATLIARLFQR